MAHATRAATLLAVVVALTAQVPQAAPRAQYSKTSPVDLVQVGFNVPGKIKPGKEFRVMDEVESVGDQPVDRSVTGFFLSRDDVWNEGDLLLGGRRIPGLSPGRTHQDVTPLKLPGIIEPGPYYLLAVADFQRLVEERYENNNIRAVKVTVQPADPPRQ
jgi:subtilase family serine protease